MLGTTFGGNHLACAAAIAVLDVIEKESLLNNATTIGSFLMDELSAFDELKNVRGKGLMIGFEPSSELKDLRKWLLFEEKIFTGAASPDVIRLLPSLSLSKSDAEHFLSSLKKAISHFSKDQKKAMPAVTS
jgi:acetylornithine aminotransferase